MARFVKLALDVNSSLVQDLSSVTTLRNLIHFEPCASDPTCVYVVLNTNLTGKEVSTDLYYNLVVLIRRLVPGYNHFCTCKVLELIHLQWQTITLKTERNGVCHSSIGTKFSYGAKKKPTSWSLLTVFPPFPITRPAAKEGTLMCASSFTSSLGPKKFSSFNLPNMRHCACSRTGGVQVILGSLLKNLYF